MLQKCQDFKESGVLLYFNGPVCQTMVESIGDVMRRRMAARNHKMTVVQKVFSVLVEQMQNIVHYCEADRPDMPQGQIVVYHENGSIHVSSGNAMNRETADRLRKIIDSLNTLNKQELKMLYKEQRRGAVPVASKGAGLGLIEMARKSGQPMSYSFCKTTESEVFFSVDVRIDAEVARCTP